jgi:uncharacterized protein GlcG (DUF336 family)
MKHFVAMACLAAVSISAPAQTLRPVLTYENAAKIRDGCLAFARDKKFDMAIAVHDESGRLLTFARMDTASTAVSEVAIWKSRSAASYRYATAETAKWNAPNMPAIATIGGGVPVFSAKGDALGAVGVSGAAAEDDIACAEAGLRAAGLRSARP